MCIPLVNVPWGGEEGGGGGEVRIVYPERGGAVKPGIIRPFASHLSKVLQACEKYKNC